MRFGQQVTPMELQTRVSSRMAALIDDADAKRRCVATSVRVPPRLGEGEGVPPDVV